MAQNKSAMMPVNVSAVSYLNTLPFLHGLKQSAVAKDIRLSLAPPFRCAELLQTNEVDISLTPVAVLPFLENYHLISDYCLGAVSSVRTVVLLSDTPLEKIQKIYLDSHSRTSAMLIQILAKQYWKINPEFIPLTDANFPLKSGEGCLLIGDKVFSHEQHFAYCYDLADAWIAFTGEPFVFAAWVSTKKIDEHFLQSFNQALEYGVTHIAEAVATEAPTFDSALAVDYLTNNINYLFDKKKCNGLELFLQLVKEYV